MIEIKDRIFENRLDGLKAKYIKPKTKYHIYLMEGKIQKATKSLHKTKLGLAYRALCRLHYK